MNKRLKKKLGLLEVKQYCIIDCERNYHYFSAGSKGVVRESKFPNAVDVKVGKLVQTILWRDITLL